MKKNEKNIDKLTSERIKNTGLEEPSTDFTWKVMQSIALVPQPKIETNHKRFWLLLVIPVIIGILSGAIVALNLSQYLVNPWPSFMHSLHPFIASFVEIFTSLKSVSPVIIFSFIAVVLLLVIEDFVRRNKQYVN